MKEMKQRLKAHNTIISIIMFIALLALLLFSVVFVQIKLKKNANEFGQSLARSYAVEEELRLETYDKIVTLASQYIDEIERNGGTPEEIQKWLENYFLKATNIVGEDMISPYAVINGEIVAAVPWEGDETYDYQSTDWYQQAIKGKGELVSSGAYEDAITGRTIYTISQELSTRGNVIAMDIYIYDQDLHQTIKTLPEKASLFLCDEEGNILFFLCEEEGQTYMKSKVLQLLSEIKAGKYDAYDATFLDSSGKERGVYYSYLDNGWLVMLTMPMEEIVVGDYERVVMVITGMGTVLFLVLIGYAIKGKRQEKAIEKADNTIQILSNSYLAIYRVKFTEGIYEKIKAEHNDKLPGTGKYGDLFTAMKENLKEEAWKEFSINFSLKSICQRVEEGVTDYAGDYLYQFGSAYRWVNVRTIYDKELAEDEVLLCLREVDEEKKQQLQHMLILQDAMEASRKSARAKSDFFSHMSHDLRTPLNAIIGFSELAGQCLVDIQKQKGYLDKITLAGKQMLGLVNDILEISKIEAGKNRLDYRQFNLKTYVEETISIFQAQAVQEHKYFSVSIQITDEVVVGDASKIGQILINLLSNAFKYSKEYADIYLEVRQFHIDKYSKYQFIVKDTGVGMSKEFLSTIFDPYTRESTADIVAATGTGLGMSIVKSLVKQMSGKISVDSVLGEGSCFTVTLPLEVVKETTEELPKEEESEKTYLAGRTILLAEDNAFNMELTTDILNMYGCEVIQAYNGKEAVKIFQKAAPYSIDVILMDMQMPEMDGCEATEKIRALDKLDAKTVPIIAVTANAFAEDIDRTTKVGMNGHIPKPIDVELLCRTLEKWIKEGI